MDGEFGSNSERFMKAGFLKKAESHIQWEKPWTRSEERSTAGGFT
jgi:hypothetical protein